MPSSSPSFCALGPHDGLLLVDKPSGPTSHDIVAKIRRRFQLPKVGHGGTLDPMATGLLVLLTGRGTKISERVMGHDKTYEGTFRLGITTDSQDAEGRVLAQGDASGIRQDQILEEMQKRLGDQMQTPPMVSAIKINGVALYKLARKGQSVERPPKLIHLYRFELLAFTPPDVRFVVECTKGTYVRTLAHDIGQALGCGAHLAQLRRTHIGTFSVAEAHSLEALMAADTLEGKILPLTAALPRLV
ncbi:MAG: tRNA pseudouridine(55) synthase TruB [Verrucomicrobiota bacterium]|jgi:tRNA pseudouridine55 synthase|nr:tRNA pseudouridine(55) synthase TruB [Verrucomicrobiota bacterium]